MATVDIGRETPNAPGYRMHSTVADMEQDRIIRRMYGGYNIRGPWFYPGRFRPPADPQTHARPGHQSLSGLGGVKTYQVDCLNWLGPVCVQYMDGQPQVYTYSGCCEGLPVPDCSDKMGPGVAAPREVTQNRGPCPAGGQTIGITSAAPAFIASTGQTAGAGLVIGNQTVPVPQALAPQEPKPNQSVPPRGVLTPAASGVSHTVDTLIQQSGGQSGDGAADPGQSNSLIWLAAAAAAVLLMSGGRS